MTGGTVLIQKGNRAILGKVRHDGDWIYKFFKKENNIFSIPFTELWEKAHKNYVNDMYGGKPSDDDIISVYTSMGYYFVWETFITIENCGDAIEYAEITIRHLQCTKVIDDYDGYTCGYMDCLVVINYDNQTIETDEFKFDDDDSGVDTH